MTDRILSILGVFRRRLVLIRAVEASAIVATASGLSAATMMGAWTLAGKFTLAAALLCALPLVAGVVLTIKKRLRYGLHSEQVIQWFVIILLTACGFAGLLCVLTGAYVNLAKNWLFLIFPAGAIFAFVVVLIRGVRLQHVAVWVDKRADLRERLSTALELIESGESDSDFGFARAVHDQAIAAADEPRLGRVGFWTAARATGGALGLTTVAVVLMLVVEPLESPSAQQQRQWQNVSGRANQTLRRQLDAIKANAASDNSAITEQIRRMEKLAGSLRAAKPADAKQWREKVFELEEIAEALREVIRSDKVDAKTAERIERLIGSLERIAAGISEGMSGGEYASTGDGNGKLGRAGQVPPPFIPKGGTPL
ncbi:MAG: hypothetical protein KAV00_06360, partial [Phycisphaerae bacterium]|nr:hypothetical protein [Phycisphaerae bacterium]